MRDGDTLSRFIGEEERHAIGGEHHAHAPGLRSDGGIGHRHLRFTENIEVGDIGAVNLLHPAWQRRQLLAHDEAIPRHVLRIVTAACTEVHRREFAAAHAARARGDERTHARGHVPIGNQPFARQAHFTSTSRRLKSAGSGDSNRAGLPVAGCANASFHACNAWRASRPGFLPA